MNKENKYKCIVTDIKTGVSTICINQYKAGALTNRTGECIRQKLVRGRVKIEDDYMLYPYTDEMAERLGLLD